MTSKDRVLLTLNHDMKRAIESPYMIQSGDRQETDGTKKAFLSADHQVNILDTKWWGSRQTPAPDSKKKCENEEFVVIQTSFGGIRKYHKNYSAIPEIADYPCKDKMGWERIKKRLIPDADRVSWHDERTAITMNKLQNDNNSSGVE
jgi:hypothetical protein